MGNLTTDNPIALQYLMSETLFTSGYETDSLPTSRVAKEQPKSSIEFDVSADEFVYKGNRSSGILFVLRYPDYPYFSPNAEEAFVKTIGALGLSLADVAIVNLANPQNPNEFRKIMDFFSPKKITLLGVEPQSLALPIIAHNSYMKGRIATVFNTFSFEEMFLDVNKKKLFWSEFKTFITS